MATIVDVTTGKNVIGVKSIGNSASSVKVISGQNRYNAETADRQSSIVDVETGVGAGVSKQYVDAGDADVTAHSDSEDERILAEAKAYTDDRMPYLIQSYITENKDLLRGDDGEPFDVYKTYPTINDMQLDYEHVPVGKFVMISSTVGDVDNGKIYKRVDFGFDFIVSMASIEGPQGEQGPQGEKGDKGDKGDPGEPGSDADVTSENVIEALGYTPADASSVPTKISDLTNDAGFITAVAWADIVGKPSSYPPSTHTHTVSQITDFPTKVSAFTNDAGYLTQHQSLANYYTKSQVDSALSTKADADDVSTLSTSVAGKADASSVYTKAQVNSLLTGKADIGAIPTVPTLISAFTNDRGYITAAQVPEVSSNSIIAALGYTPADEADIPEIPSNVSYFTNDAGYLTSHQSLANYYTKAQVDEALGDKADLTDVPTIPTAVSAFTNDVGYLTQHQSLANYYTKSQTQNQISSAVSSASATLQAAIDLKADASSIPTKVSDLTNDAGYITLAQVPDVSSSSIISALGYTPADSASLTTALIYKGSVASFGDLPASGNKKGDVYNVVAADGEIPAGTNYAWNGSSWDALGGAVDLSAYALTTDIPTNVSQLTNDAGYLTQHQSLAGYVPTSRKVNNKALTGDISLTASDVGALASNGNAASATEFSSNKSVTLTGDVTGSASSKAGWSIATTLANSGATAGSYGPSADASPSAGGTFSVPYFTVDAKGRVTAASTKTITVPSSATDSTKLPLAGGTMTGTILSPRIAIKRSVDDDELVFYGDLTGNSPSTGSCLALRGRSRSSDTGTVFMRAGNGTDSSVLTLFPSGVMRWSGRQFTMNDGTRNYPVLTMYQEDASHNYGATILLGAANINSESADSATGGAVYVGSGESPGALYATLAETYADETAPVRINPKNEILHLSSDTEINLWLGCNTIANRARIRLDTYGNKYVDSNFDRDSNSSSRTLDWNFRDKNANLLARYRMGLSSANEHRCTFSVFDDLGIEKGYIGLYTNRNGTNTYTHAPTPPVGDSSTQIATTEWVTALAGNYLPLTGGTLTGNLVVEDNNIYLKDTELARNETPASSKFFSLQKLDKNGSAFGKFQFGKYSSGSNQAHVVVNRPDTGEEYVGIRVCATMPDTENNLPAYQFTEIAGQLRLTRTQDLSGTADNRPALSIGSVTGAHLEFDQNEIHAKASGTTVAPLFINDQGGNVYINNTNAVRTPVKDAATGDADTPVYIDSVGVVQSTGKHFSDYLPLTGGTLTGNLDVNNVGTTTDSQNHRFRVTCNNDYGVILQHSGVTKGTNPSSTVNNLITFAGTAFTNYNYRLGFIGNTVATNGKVSTRMVARSNASATANTAGEINVSVATDGTITTQAPTPPVSDDSTQIATTAYVKDCVPKTVGDANTPVYVNANGVVTSTGKSFANYVPTSRKVNGKALSGDITLTASDVGADASGVGAVGVDNGSLAVGSYVVARPKPGNTVSNGATISGGNLNAVYFYSKGSTSFNGTAQDSVSLSGTWRNVCGTTLASSPSTTQTSSRADSAGLFQRIS